MTRFLPLIDSDESRNDLLDSLSLLGPLIVSSTHPDYPYDSHVLLDQNSPLSVDQIIELLDSGVDKVILPLASAKEVIGAIPQERLILLLDVASVSAVSDTVRNGVSGVLLKTPEIDLDLITSISQFFANSLIHVLSDSSNPPSIKTIRALFATGANLVLRSPQLTLSRTSPTQINIADTFLAPIASDRPDGLFPTVVSTQTGHSLGLVYSSVESIRESILTGKGVYQSRKQGLWRKGETSGATQTVVSIRLDCDSDSVEFRVAQHGAGFCHLGRQSCFGDARGLAALEKTLASRFESAPAGSYTKRLFDDSQLLHSKILEEADELCRAQTAEEVSFEAADLFYFALTKCTAFGVGITDIERSLDKKAKKVTRRPGNAKPQWTQKAPGPSTATQTPSQPTAPDLPIRMRTSNLSEVSLEARAALLRRPVLKSDEMIEKIKPIVSEVRVRGDAALLEFTTKFDKAKLKSTCVFPPYPREGMQLPEDVKLAIDKAYENIKKFHQAQTDGTTLQVETMPGVVCSRFARPIARVGLYIPGGTAILPSTALMLGIPAQVAGCKEVVFATPPRPDGSISPEVLYVAQLVGASAILKAGGAQAIAAMAYGTETVPKVDKIFGPGNQWVTAAKMLVQNDTDALVSIDMPAGPSEVLVIADYTANPAFVAADLLSQAEHGVDSQVVLVAVNLTPEHLARIESEVDKQARALSRVDILKESIPKSIIVQAPTIDEAVSFSNDYAPEHLILHLEDAAARVKSIENAGSVFVGPYTPESCGDYASGTNHTLPTNGYARQFSGVNTQSFQKHITSQEITSDGLKILGPIVATLADCEGLSAHANAVRIRLGGNYV
ncbi:histidine biosynthesis trifunctional-protein [Marasmius fiardii PR-910]|nr:histidine biosynthesis trifunctional-protein [Marasmius fiardii PR-910]